MSRNADFERALAHDDALDLRRGRRAPDAQAAEGRCVILFDYETACDQCGRSCRRPHIIAGWTYCRRCCPACARAIAAS